MWLVTKEAVSEHSRTNTSSGSGGGSAAADGSAGEGAGVLAVVYYQLAVYQDVLDSCGVLLWPVAGGRRLHRGRVEDDDVGLHVVQEQASVGYAQAQRREGRHLPDRLLQSDGAFVADVVGEDGREGAVGPRAGIVPQQQTVGSHHRERMGHEVGQGRKVWPGGHVGGLKVFVEEEVAQGVDLALYPSSQPPRRRSVPQTSDCGDA